MLGLGIESTCDESAAAIVKDGHHIISNVISSQEELHKKYGGVFPELASRLHVDHVIPVIQEALLRAEVRANDLDFIAVANTPGLIGSILVGLNTAKALSLVWNKPLVGVHHVEAHLYASMMGNLDALEFPALGIVLSGGHTMMLLIHGIGQYEVIGATLDDAIGEAFDKVASLLQLPYPGGPQVEKLAVEGDPFYFPFRPGTISERPYDFSFSGLKTQVLYTVKGMGGKKNDPLVIAEKEKKHVAASFQHTAFSDVLSKACHALSEFQCKAIYLGGGVSNNRKIREMFQSSSLSVPVYWPAPLLSLDNGAMIAGLGYQKFIRGQKDSFELAALPFRATFL